MSTFCSHVHFFFWNFLHVSTEGIEGSERKCWVKKNPKTQPTQLVLGAKKVAHKNEMEIKLSADAKKLLSHFFDFNESALWFRRI